MLSTNRQKLAAESAPYFGFAPADDPEAVLTANALYFRIQVHSIFCCAHICEHGPCRKLIARVSLSMYHCMYIQGLLVTSRQACRCSGRRADSSILNPLLTRGLSSAAAGTADRKARPCHGHGGEPLPGHEASPARCVTLCNYFSVAFW